ncbi:ectin-like isoform X2 [Hydractinia symbiolongicarpus]|uniref:ectin-like isoform X2 n=1 Tax=Hydractinia symbiolongicarpus TaxID=13093 RepID=UPI00254A5BAC|nr:ectin-like isoform X2 [Hydractinia symbiolongicarpus]
MVNIPDGQQVRVKQPIYVCEDKDACLYAHNKVRSYHGVGTLSWDERLARDAKNWAIYLIENNCFMHDKRIHDGENLYVISGDPEFHRVYQAVQELYSIGQNYDNSIQVRPQVQNENGELFIPQCEDLIWENDVKPTIRRVNHYIK